MYQINGTDIRFLYHTDGYFHFFAYQIDGNSHSLAYENKTDILIRRLPPVMGSFERATVCCELLSIYQTQFFFYLHHQLHAKCFERSLMARFWQEIFAPFNL
jgi:hypothetical protein